MAFTEKQQWVATAALALFRTVLRFPWASTALLLTVLFAGAFYSVQALKFDVSLEGLLGEGTPTVSDYQAFMGRFSHDQNFILLIETDDVLSRQGLAELLAITTQAEALHPAIESVTSILDLPLTDTTRERTLVGNVGDLLNANKTFSLAHWVKDVAPHYPMLSFDRRRTLMILHIQPEAGQVVPSGEVLSQVLDAVDGKVEDWNRDNVQVSYAGQGAFLGLVRQLLVSDLYLLPVMSIGAALLLLWFLFQRLSGILLPVLVVVPPVIFTFALMSIADIPIRISSILMPPALIVIGIASAVHVVTGFFQQYRQSMNQQEVMAEVIKVKALALLTTTVTTASAFAAFFGVPLASVSELGMLAALGTLLIFPSLIIISALYVHFVRIRPYDNDQEVGGWLAGCFSYIAEKSAVFARTFPKAVVIIAVVLFVGGALGVTKAKLSHQPENWLPMDHPISHTSQKITSEFTMSLALEIEIDSGTYSGAVSPEFMLAVGEAAITLNQLPVELMRASDVEGLLSASISKSTASKSDTEKSEKNNLSDFYLLKLTTPETIARFVSSDYRYQRLSMRLPMTQGIEYQPVIDWVNHVLAKTMNEKYSFVLTGQPTIMAETHQRLIDSATWGYSVSLVALWLMMMVFTRDILVGSLLMLPNLLPVLIVVGVMPMLNVPLDLMSLLVVSVSMGLVVDDTVHFAAAFNAYRQEGLSPGASVQAALNGSGRAMLLTTLVLVIGWQMLFISNFESVSVFGYLTSAIMALGIVADFILAPALLLLVSRLRGADKAV